MFKGHEAPQPKRPPKTKQAAEKEPIMIDHEKLKEANRWLEKAITLEADGKSQKIVDMALDKACKFELEANGYLPKAA